MGNGRPRKRQRSEWGWTTASTAKPRSSSRRTAPAPMKPAAPVTRTRSATGRGSGVAQGTQEGLRAAAHLFVLLGAEFRGRLLVCLRRGDADRPPGVDLAQRLAVPGGLREGGRIADSHPAEDAPKGAPRVGHEVFVAEDMDARSEEHTSELQSP